MDLENLKIRTNEIRLQHQNRKKVSWPKDFKLEVVQAIDSGLTVKEVSSALGLNFPTVFMWKRKFPTSPKNNFKSLSLVGEAKDLSLSWTAGLEVKGLSFSELKELLKEGLL